MDLLSWLLFSLIVVVIISITIIANLQNKLKDAKEKAVFMGTALSLNYDFLGMTFIPIEFYEKKHQGYDYMSYIVKAAVNDPHSVYLFEISMDDFKLMNEYEGSKVFILESKLDGPGKTIYYFKPIPKEKIFKVFSGIHFTEMIES